MEGVRILNEISSISEDVWISIGLFILIGIVVLLYGLTSCDFDRRSKIGMSLVSLVPFIIAIIVFFTNYLSPMKYEVIIDDNVKLVEFEEKYRIIERRGNIYVVEERENE